MNHQTILGRMFCHWVLMIGASLVMSIGCLAIPMTHADETVDAIQHTYQNMTDLQAKFTQNTMITTVGKEVTNTGVLYLKKPGLLRLEYQGNPQRQYVSNGKILWVFTPGDHQYQKFQIGGKILPKEALTFLSGFGELTTLFQVAYQERDRTVPSHTYLRLRPRRPSTYTQLDCEFDERHLLIKLTIYNPSGNQTDYRFSQIQINPGLRSDLFQFLPPAGAKEVRMEGN